MSKKPSSTEVSQNFEIKIGALRTALRVASGYKRERDFCSLMVLSQPGIGKTETITEFAKDIGARLETVVASTLDRMDVAGLPYTVTDEKLGNVTRFAPMELLANLCKKRNPGGGAVVLYFNELMDAPESTYPVLMRLFNERAIGDIVLRDNVVLIGDGNPPECNVSGRSLPFAMRRRFAWFVVRADVQEWTEWALAHEVDARLVSFFQVPAFQEHFAKFDPVGMRHAITYPCPASWTKLAKSLPEILDIFGIDEGNAIERSAYIASHVGTEAATAFNAYLKHMKDLSETDVKKIMEEPERAKLPKEPSMLGLLIGSAVHLAKNNPKMLDNLCRLANVLLSGNDPQHSYPEYGVFLVRAANLVTALRGKINKCPAFENTKKLVKERPELMSALVFAVENAGR
jgi:hypothetical protein